MGRARPPVSNAAPRERSWWPWAIAYAAAVALVGLASASKPLYDDAYFFERFARNALLGAGFSWNRADGPVHGLTSQLYMLWLTPWTAVAKAHWIALVHLLDAVALVAAGGWLFRWLWKEEIREARVLGLVLAGLCSPVLIGTAETGMETAYAAAACVFAATRMLPRRAGGSADAGPTERGAWVVLLYLLRPDAALIPGILMLGAAWEERRWPWRASIVAGLGLALVWGGCRAYYGSALPLPFFMKTLAMENYGPEVIALGWKVKAEHLGLVVGLGLPFVCFAIPAVVAGDARVRLCLFAGLATVAYHAGLTNEIMGYRARFYVPGLLMLVLAGALSAKRLEPAQEASRGGGPRWGALACLVAGYLGLAFAHTKGWIPGASGDPQRAIPGSAYLAWVLASVWAWFPHHRGQGVLIATVALGGVVAAWPPRELELRSDEAIRAEQASKLSSLRGMEAVARCLPPTATVFHSEMGLLGARLFDATLVDLVGILSPEFSIEARDFDAVCELRRPEAIFLPHRNYVRLRREIRASACFTGYRRQIARSSAPLFVRADLAPAFGRCRAEAGR